MEYKLRELLLAGIEIHIANIIWNTFNGYLILQRQNSSQSNKRSAKGYYVKAINYNFANLYLNHGIVGRSIINYFDPVSTSQISIQMVWYIYR